MPYDISKVLDLTAEQRDPPVVEGKHLLRKGKVVKRLPSTVTGIVVHQTACEFGVSPSQVKASGGDPILAKHRRFLDIACHVGAAMTGKALYVNPLEWYVYHGNGFNETTLGLEIEGLYPGIYADPKTAWTDGGRLKISEYREATVEAARLAITFAVVRGRERGMPIKWVYAHRQSSPTRRSDPGDRLWKDVVLDYAVPVLGLKTQPGLILKNRAGEPGRAIPPEWDPQGVGNY